MFNERCSLDEHNGTNGSLQLVDGLQWQYYPSGSFHLDSIEFRFSFTFFSVSNNLLTIHLNSSDWNPIGDAENRKSI